MVYLKMINYEAERDRSGENYSPDQQISWWAGNVALRFEVYTQAEPYFDIYAEIYDRLRLSDGELLVDVGSYDGSFIFWLKSKHQKGQFIGIEPDVSAMKPFHNQYHARFYKNLAQNLPGANASVDVLTANFMIYFGDEQEACLEEFKRVLKPSGKFVLSDSGDFNKVRQRVFETKIADKYGVKPPRLMNQKFDSDIAAETLPHYFRNIYHGSYHGKMVFQSEEEAVKYYHSLLSMKDFFEPRLSEEEMGAAYQEIVAPVVSREITQLGRFEDYIQRDFFICNDDPHGLWMNDPRRGEMLTVKGYRQEQLGADYARAA